jgi:hypothetical protein
VDGDTLDDEKVIDLPFDRCFSLHKLLLTLGLLGERVHLIIYNLDFYCSRNFFHTADMNLVVLSHS